MPYGSNSTWFQCTNSCLDACGQTQISSTTNFDNPIGNLSRVQQLARKFVQLCDMALNVKKFNRNSTQEFIITTQTANPLKQSTFQYALDSSVTVENLRYLSFFNITPQGTAQAPLGAPLFNWDYRSFRTVYPDFTALTDIMTPTRWIILPRNLSQPQGIIQDMIMFWPLPDQAYTIVYQAQQFAQPLSLSSSQVLWLPQYEHVLWQYAKTMLHVELGEGKEQAAAQYAEKFVSDYLFWICGPEEEKKAVRTGMNIRGVRKGRRVNFWSDTPAYNGSN